MKTTKLLKYGWCDRCNVYRISLNIDRKPSFNYYISQVILYFVISFTIYFLFIYYFFMFYYIYSLDTLDVVRVTFVDVYSTYVILVSYGLIMPTLCIADGDCSFKFILVISSVYLVSFIITCGVLFYVDLYSYGVILSMSYLALAWYNLILSSIGFTLLSIYSLYKYLK